MEIEKLRSILKINSVAMYMSTDSFYDILMEYKDPDVFFTRTDEIMLPNELLKEKLRKFVSDALRFDAEREIEECEKLKIKIVTCLDDDYPAQLREISNPPLVLYFMGDISPRLSVSIVGTRHPTDYGIKHASKISFDLASSGICIVSGLARGIDSVVHRSAIKAKGITRAIIGSGLKKIYPPENRSIINKIIEYGGAVISEYPLDTAPLKFNFPRRNRLISAFSFATVVIEGDFSSGALITARYAVEQGREVMALPGPVDVRQSNGPNKLIKDGAYPVRNAMDVIDLIPASELFGIDINKIKDNQTSKKYEMSDDAARIYTILKEKGSLSVDEIADILSLNVSEALAYLFELETIGAVELCGGRYKTTL